jgi:hypothetical protein
MLPYFIALILMMSAVLLAEVFKGSRAAKTFLILLAIVVLVGLGGWRDSSVGTDTPGYVSIYEEYSVYSALSERRTVERSYALMSEFATWISHDYWAILTLIITITVSLNVVAIYRMSAMPPVSLFVFLTMGYYTFAFNTARQAVACGILTLGFYWMTKGSFWRYAAYVVAASVFHRSAIVALPLYFVCRHRTNWRFLCLTILGAGLFAISFKAILRLGAIISERYTIYQDMETAGGGWSVALYVALAMFFYWYRSMVVVGRREYEVLLNLLIVGSSLAFVITVFGGVVELNRIAIYFQVATMFLWPYVIMATRIPLNRFALITTAGIAHLVIYYFVLKRLGDVTPYQFNEDAPWSSLFF